MAEKLDLIRQLDKAFMDAADYVVGIEDYSIKNRMKNSFVTARVQTILDNLKNEFLLEENAMSQEHMDYIQARSDASLERAL
jgi:hypothetical protein